MSDIEFWKSTPAKIFALLDYHSSVENPQDVKNKKLNNESLPKMTPEIFKQWSRQLSLDHFILNDWRNKMAGKTKNVGNIESKLLLDTKDFEQGVTRTEKRLLKLTGDFIKTQQNINGSLRNLNATFKENTDEISKRVGKVKDAVNGLNEANKGYSKNIVVAISSMEKSVVAELSKISQAFKELKVVSNENFDKGIKTLDRSVKQSSNNIKVS